MWHDKDVSSAKELRPEQIFNALKHLWSVLERDQGVEPDFPNPHPSQTRDQVFAERDRLRSDYQGRRADAREGAMRDFEELLDELRDRMIESPPPRI